MTATLEALAPSTHDEVEHIICPGCWPTFVPGRTVTAMCGSAAPDDPNYLPPDLALVPNLCVVCVDLMDKPCPRCTDAKTYLEDA